MSWSELQIVQFPHPGAEHRVDGDLMPWNRGEHKRKFLVANGRYLEGGRLVDGAFAFWGEWEPPSRVMRRFQSRDPELPKALHEPFWTVPRHRSLLQNTDPLVYGERFLYSNCRQRHNAKLQAMAPGSLVLFGSKRRTGFVLDTVFVVGEPGQRYRQGAPEGLAPEPWIDEVVLGPLSRGRGTPDQSFTLYRGRRYDDPSAGPFSFVPCRPLADPEVAFPRPTIQLPRTLLNPNLAMGAKASLASRRDVEEVWQEVVAQMERAGLALGVDLAAPPFVEDASPTVRRRVSSPERADRVSPS